jgi:predicted ATPase/class 3 adenylate cyclase
MTCPRCRAQNDEGARFCEDCGARLEVVCPTCGSAVTPGKKFCRSCGATLPSDSAGRFRSPAAYTPKYLAEKILTSKSALEGERKQVTVLFADLKGSMELLADRDPEEARKVLDPVLEHMMEAVHHYEGTVNQVMGDGIMALFGAPLAHEDHAVRACYAALRMQDLIKRYAEGVRRVEGISIRIRVGLNSGEVVVRAIGSDLHMDYTAVGQTTHLAARMEQLAEPGTTIFTPATHALCEDFVQVKSLGPMRVKGLAEPLEAYELTGANPVRSRFHAHAARGLTKFVGRTSELAQLGDALDLARSGRGQVVAVVGEPGVGKSRLFWEFTHSYRTTGCLVLEAASVSYGKATTYFPVIELLRGYFQIEPRDDARKIREKVTGKLLSLDRALEAALPPLLAILDAPVEDDQWTRLDPPQRRQRTLDAVKLLLLRESRVQPLVVVFEDLHWIDGETQTVLERLIESLPTAPMLLIVNYRPEYQHLWGSKTYYRQLRLDALPTASAEELLESLLGNDPGLASLKRLLTERTEGNPFFLEESVRTLVETNVLTGEASAYRVTKAPARLQFPPTARAILAARIDRLLPEDKRLLQAAAVVGKDVPFALLQTIVDDTAGSIHESLARLQAAEFLYETQLFPEVEYTFKHALTHEVAYGGLLNAQRKALHGKVLAAIEHRTRISLTDQAERLFHHAARAENAAKVARYGDWAGRRAAERCAYGDAVTYFDQALGAVSGMPEARETLELAIDIRIGLRRALLPLGQAPTAFARLSEALELAKKLGDPARLTSTTGLMIHQLWLASRTTEAKRYVNMALKQVESVSDKTIALPVYHVVGQALYFWGDWSLADELLSRAVDEHQSDSDDLRSLGIPPASVSSRALLGALRADQGRSDDAMQLCAEAVRVAESLRRPYSVAYATIWFAYVALTQGKLDDATRLCQTGLTLASETDIRFFLPFCHAGLGRAAMLAGRVADAVSLIREGKTEQLSMGFRYNLPLIAVWLAEALALNGQNSEAMAELRDALKLAIEAGERLNESRIYRILGLTSADHQDAENWYKRGITLADAIGAKPELAHGHADLARRYRQSGKTEQAAKHFATAATMYRDMRLTYWLERANAELQGA